MAKVSVLVDNRTDTAGAVLAASRVHGAAAAADVANQFAHVDEQMIRALLMSLEELLEGVTAKMRESEVSYAGERGETSRLREERDELHAELSDVYLQVRSLVEGSAGSRATADFGIDGGMPHTFKALVETSHNAVERLRTAQNVGRGPLGVLFDADKFADALEGPMTSARAVLERMRSEAREDELAMLERDQTVEEWERVYRGVALILQGFFTIAGRPELAERVRPTERRATGRDVQPDGGGDPQPEPVVEPDPVEPEPAADEA
ncbi:hypothetical protein FIV42_27780 [Persicimonas caeni]|uniref:Uncharacterized protein n=1 Tax=Persicimonas caeni TaxID=2292766 RepID=A0A4Y6Q1E9_PERCE|nr:hypothetical protein [Persicimonas caeni]QDG54408.1 hypothetical protein FIV42_27780 [Persicimonas caeni]QED35629.1 hypothetical protein FRD00_27775 [Persicimonas caeni]